MSAVHRGRLPVDRFIAEIAAVEFELIAGSVLAKSLLEQARFADAQLAVESASALASKSQNRSVSLKFAITAARVSAAAGKLDQAKSISGNSPALPEPRISG